MSSGNKVDWPGGQGTGASHTGYLSCQGSVLAYILTSSNPRPALGPSQRPLPSNPSTGLRCSDLAQDQLVSPKGKPWPTRPGTPSVKANRFSGVQRWVWAEGTPRPMRGWARRGEVLLDSTLPEACPGISSSLLY